MVAHNGAGASGPTVAVVMSTYNGAQYLRDQIESVLVQDVRNLHLHVRDDGSSDATPRILGTYERAGLAQVTYGENRGVSDSFFTCLRDAGDADYYAFCDQDDLWLTDKISRALGMLEAHDNTRPLLYCSELNYCSPELRFERTSHLNRRGVSFKTQLYETICSGNTMVFNAALRTKILEVGWRGAFLHDWWTSLVACAFGTVVWDEESRIMYRRTAENVSPSGANALALQLYRIRKILGGGQTAQIQDQLRCFYEACGPQLKPSDEALLRRVTHASAPVRALTPARMRQGAPDELLLRASMLFGLI